MEKSITTGSSMLPAEKKRVTCNPQQTDISAVAGHSG